jgi:hypothetical protein
MKLVFTLILFLLGLTGFAQNWEITPNYIKIPSVSTLPDCSPGRIVFKTPENKLYSCDGTSWKPLSSLQQEGFSAPLNCCKTYPNFVSVVDLDEAEFTYGSGGFSASADAYTVPSDGVYQISASFTTATFDATPVNFYLIVYLFRNGNTVRRTGHPNLSSELNSTVRLDEALKLTAGDVIQMKINHNYTASGLTPNPEGSHFSIIKLY